MTLYVLSESENNGYHDSDFFAHCLNTETIEFEKVLIGTTRFAGCITHNFQCCYVCHNVVKPTEQQLEQLKPLIEIAKEKSALKLQAYKAEHPECNIGEVISFKKNIRNKKCQFVNCDSCDSTGYWINPSNKNDKRFCFACDGIGIKKIKLSGMVTYPQGTVAKIVSKKYHPRYKVYNCVALTSNNELVNVSKEDCRKA